MLLKRPMVLPGLINPPVFLAAKSGLLSSQIGAVWNVEEFRGIGYRPLMEMGSSMRPVISDAPIRRRLGYQGRAIEYASRNRTGESKSNSRVGAGGCGWHPLGCRAVWARMRASEEGGRR